MYRRIYLTFYCLSSILISSSEARTQARPKNADWPARNERVEDFGKWVDAAHRFAGKTPKIKLERITAGVPWPRGIALVDDRLIVLARGRHRRAGGVDPAVPDLCGTLFSVDILLAEVVKPGEKASAKIVANASVLARPTSPPFLLFDPSREPISNSAIDRPYCTLIYDKRTRNLFICGFSGVDLPGAKFRKNASDSIHRYDLRNKTWYVVEAHDYSVVPEEELGYVVANNSYPHHDPQKNKAPHGWLNGPDGGCIAGDYLYCVGKDNHSIARYDLTEIRANAKAGPPDSVQVLDSRVNIMRAGKIREIQALGPSVAAAHGGYLYIGYRTSSIILRFPIDPVGRLRPNPIGELVAIFEAWDPKRKRSANLIDMAFNSQGELFVSCAKEGKIWNIGRPDPKKIFNGNDRGKLQTTAEPWLDLAKATGKKTSCGNILFDEQDRLYLCVGNYDAGGNLAGAVYRATELR